jgi:hypothetical protein
MHQNAPAISFSNIAKSRHSSTPRLHFEVHLLWWCHLQYDHDLHSASTKA